MTGETVSIIVIVNSTQKRKTGRDSNTGRTLLFAGGGGVGGSDRGRAHLTMARLFCTGGGDGGLGDGGSTGRIELDVNVCLGLGRLQRFASRVAFELSKL